MGKRNPGMLHLQLGQEVIYLVMAASLFAALALAILLVRERAEVRRNEQPPIITLEESKGYSFASGSAELTADFRALLRDDVLPKLIERSDRYSAQVVEVIGHTDEQPLGATSVSTMDTDLLTFLDCGRRVAPPGAADNTGLGMARAAAVACALREDSRSADLIILPLSAGQAITTDERLAAPGGQLHEARRRRIEIRLRRPAPS